MKLFLNKEKYLIDYYLKKDKTLSIKRHSFLNPINNYNKNLNSVIKSLNTRNIDNINVLGELAKQPTLLSSSFVYNTDVSVSSTSISSYSSYLQKTKKNNHTLTNKEENLQLIKDNNGSSVITSTNITDKQKKEIQVNNKIIESKKKRRLKRANNLITILNRVSEIYHVNLRQLFFKFNIMKSINQSNTLLYNFNKINYRQNMQNALDYTGSLLKSNVSVLLKSFFWNLLNYEKAIDNHVPILISKPVFVFNQDKIIIQLSYYLDVKLLNYLKNKFKFFINIFNIMIRKNTKNSKIFIKTKLIHKLFLGVPLFKYNLPYFSEMVKFFAFVSSSKISGKKKDLNLKLNASRHILSVPKFKEDNRLLQPASYTGRRQLLTNLNFTENNNVNFIKFSAHSQKQLNNSNQKNHHFSLSKDVYLLKILKQENNLKNKVPGSLIKNYIKSNKRNIISKNYLIKNSRFKKLINTNLFNVNNLFYKFIIKHKLARLVSFLEHVFQKSVQLELTQLYYPVFNSNILAQIIGINGKHYNFRLSYYTLINRIKMLNLRRRKFYKHNFFPNNYFSLPSYFAGVKIRLAGRFYNQIIIPKLTVKTVQYGCLARGIINHVDSSRYINKSKRGSFSITVSISHIF